jgi:hypothetical protein
MAITILRYAATAAFGGLTAAYAYYPHATWIPIVLGMLGTLGIHVIPAAPAIQGKAADQPVVPPEVR